MQTKDYEEEVTAAISSNSVTLEPEGIIYVNVVGSQDAKSVLQVNDECDKIIKNLDYKPNILSNLINAGFPDKGAREQIVKVFNRDDYNYQAMFGLNEGIRAVTNILLRKVLRGKRTQFFKTEQEARAWLAKHPVK